MLKHVLVPLDGSELALKALNEASCIADKGCLITLVTAVQAPEIPIYGIEPMVIVSGRNLPTQEDIRSDAQRYLREIADRLENQGFRPKICIEIGEPSQVILDVAERLNVDLIIMSTHGRSGLSRWLLGSVANEVLSATTHPVLIVPSRNVHAQPLETTPSEAVQA